MRIREVLSSGQKHASRMVPVAFFHVGFVGEFVREGDHGGLEGGDCAGEGVARHCWWWWEEGGAGKIFLL